MPYRLRSRFESLGAYITERIDQAIAGMRRRASTDWRGPIVLTSERRARIETIVFVVEVCRFFQDGTRAASLATDAFESLEHAGFTIGNTLFEGRNENVMRGQRLRDTLLAAVGDEEITRWAESDVPLGQMIDRLVEGAR